ncbi:hypothetical protein [Lysobacter humi (ex Lee et al. 2017)]
MRHLPLLLLAVAPVLYAATPVLRDDFSRRTSGWSDNGSRGHLSRGFSTYTPSGKYQMTPTADGTVGVSLAPKQAASPDVEIGADLFMYAGIGAGASGVVCRFRDHDNYYAFVASGAPGWLILKVQGGKPTPIARGTLPKGVMPGAVEGRLQARCEGDRLRMAFGGRVVGEARDATFATGKAGLIVMGEAAAGTSATFDDVALDDLAR